ncbi:DUF305 domain-containing protein [Streptomyces sp. P9(2023)]|uniref:DUF305 domain-containing protein n=1 Tax=Streptomyces sp. P9(2023) TaxID=3064394 RepID=UPI0028F3E3D3|nr:DUF305 domain-containing protein [Streptomyces sp. P9(2023)]MDT9687218.1 DUF305 domain-containing protein [Streptomyces sp. P9(2023)]
MRTFNHPTAPKLALTGAVLVAGLLLSGCGTDSSEATPASAPSASSASPTAAPTAAAFNDADVAFAQAMIPHHEQALEMAKLADGRAEDAGVKKIVADVEKAQDPEIRTMKAWVKAWGKPETAGDGGGHSSGHGGGDAMAGMMSEQDMKDLGTLRGKAFDRKFAELMIAHHEGAVEMAETERKNGRDAKARKLADDVVRTQSAEIAELRKILERL